MPKTGCSVFSSNVGCHTAAVMYSVISSDKRHGLDPLALPAGHFRQAPDMIVSQLSEPLPDNWRDSNTK